MIDFSYEYLDEAEERLAARRGAKHRHARGPAWDGSANARPTTREDPYRIWQMR